MKKYIKEIADLGSPVSPKFNKCSPRFRKKILNIVRNIHIITDDKDEDNEFPELIDEKNRKIELGYHSDVSFSSKIKVKCLSLQEDFNKMESCNEFPSEIKELVLKNDDFESDNQKINDFEPTVTNKVFDIDKNETEENLILIQGFIDSDGDSPTKDTNNLNQKHRTSLKDELFGFDTNQFNFVDANCDDY